MSFIHSLTKFLVVFTAVFLFSCGDDSSNEKPQESAEPVESAESSKTGANTENNILLKKQAETQGKAIDAANDLLQKQQEMMQGIDSQ